MGWQPDYPGEAKLYAKYILKHKPSAKIGVLYQNDAYGKNYLAGLEDRARQRTTNEIVDTESYNVTDSGPVVGSHVVPDRGAAAPNVSSSSRRRPRRSRRSPRKGRPQLEPLTFLNNVSANRIFLQIAAAQRGERRTA